MDSNHRLTKDELHLYAKMMRKRRKERKKFAALRKENARTNFVHKKPKKHIQPL